MKIIIVSHPSRLYMVEKLLRHLKAVVVFDTTSALSGHRTALQIASAEQEHTVIMEDDAIPVEDFCRKASVWIERFPTDLMSFYLGTSRPPNYQKVVTTKVDHALQFGSDFIRIQRLIHGVCYCLPPGGAKYVLERMRGPEADFAIGDAWGRPVVYPIESLVEHRDTTPVERHPDGQPRTERRVARRLAGKLLYQP